MNNETWREQCDDLLSVTNHQQARIAELESTIAAIGTVLYGVHCCIEFDEENGASRERLLAELKYVRDELAQAQAHAEDQRQRAKDGGGGRSGPITSEDDM
jgi:hypothetical protein